MKVRFFKPVRDAFLGGAALLLVYFTVLALVSGWDFARTQFLSFWYFIVGLAAGFGVQIGLYSYLIGMTKKHTESGGIVMVSGGTSTLAMISCCSHYLANVLPVLGVVGAVTFIAQYQIELFWLGLAFNLLGIFYLSRKVLQLSGTQYAK
ncbi:MAG: hypothetical protein HYS83_01280 [Candidatus Blackburnbacteria bacterium]|nr:hypothetical protein [Candidatus Blackburnbacteria bacterium]